MGAIIDACDVVCTQIADSSFAGLGMYAICFASCVAGGIAYYALYLTELTMPDNPFMNPQAPDCMKKGILAKATRPSTVLRIQHG